MRHLTKKLLAALATATLAASGVAAATALPAAASTAASTGTASTVQGGALFSGTGKGIKEAVALANAEAAARNLALFHGFTECDVFESVVSQDPGSLVFFAVVSVRCVDVSR
ncbi:hypothetical protein [Nonomuraea zeae]|uniref:DUF732 domain-containing protein n=1 Tax=Nonomuraea zeae TaxID=1642303 RepID=A0A5S4G7R7_9ACTN|nr:hypothetical protein [Nonomuraea zeae]TMR29055.1 hypothetical protein ETD85_33620 [Nonomuraea zeae]